MEKISQNVNLEKEISIATKENFVKRLWEKDATLWKTEEKHIEIIKNSLGWLDIPYKMLTKIQEINSFVEEIKDEGFKYAVLLGMGGSSLAPAVYQSLFQKKNYPRLFVLDTTHPETILRVRKAIDIKKTLFIFSSKSGGTIEPNTQFKYFWAELKKSKIKNPGNNFIAITDKNTSLEKLAITNNFRKIFINPSDIGGRFSALSYFGLVPAALCGSDIKTILEKSIKTADLCQLQQVSENPGFILGAFMANAYFQGKDKLTLILPKQLKMLGLWIEQLIAESTGKEGKGIIPISETQELSNYSEDRAFVYFNPKSEIPDNFPYYISNLKDNYDIGCEFFKWEIATATAGYFLKINPFDQPNVQESKTLTVEILKNIETGKKIEDKPDYIFDEVLYYLWQNDEIFNTEKDPKNIFENILTKAKKGDYIGILAYLDENSENDNSLKTLVKNITEVTGLACFYSYGPRYLHSTGQLFKGGKENGLFIILTSKPKKDIKLEGEKYTFGDLNIAQAIGDFKAIKGKGRKVIRIHMKKGKTEKFLKTLSNKLAGKKGISSPLTEEKMVKLAEKKTTKTNRKAATNSNDYIVIDYPKNLETITSRHYTIRIGASNCQSVDVSIDDQPWTPCRFSVGYWWYDWNDIQPGTHQIVARLNKPNGEFLISKRRRCKVV